MSLPEGEILHAAVRSCMLRKAALPQRQIGTWRQHPHPGCLSGGLCDLMDGEWMVDNASVSKSSGDE